MSNELDVTPPELDTASGALTGALTAAGSAITAAFSSLLPAPAGADDVSVRSAGAFGGFAEVIGAALSGGLGIAQAGAQALVPMAANYKSADAGGDVSSSVPRPDIA